MKPFRLITLLLLSLPVSLGAQNITVRGTVKDSSGEPVPAAAVLVRGTSTGVSADMEGAFVISVDPKATLVVSSIGYQEETVPVNGRTSIQVVLQEDTQMLDETIVVAFGTSTKEAFTGSAKVVHSEELAKSQVSNVTSALSGKVAGVQMVQSSGQPGSNPSIRIRGFSSISASSAPLYVVDGVPYDGDLNNLNPNDVESMSVLKDAASNSLYGARGANGVIMITTERSKERDAVITLDAKYGINQRALANYDYISSPYTYYETHFAALYNRYILDGMDASAATREANRILPGPSASGGLGYLVFTVPDGQSFIGKNGKINPSASLGSIAEYNGQDFFLYPDNWDQAGFRTGSRQEYNLSVSGGGDKANIYASLGWLKNLGITEKSDMTRFTSRLRADYQAKPWVKISGNMSYTKYDMNSIDYEGEGSTGNIWMYTSTVAPIYPLYIRNIDGSHRYDANGIEMMDLGDGNNGGSTRPYLTNYNAILTNRLDTSYSEGNAFTGSGAADFTFLKYFKLTLNMGANLDETRYTSVNNPYYGMSVTRNGDVYKYHYRRYNFNTQQLLNYTQSFGKHNVNVMAGHEAYRSYYYYLSAGRNTMFSMDNQELNGAVTDSGASSSYTTYYNNEGYFSRAQYDYDTRIFLSASYRRDASSRFHPDHRWGDFWSVGGAWILNKETWFHASWVDMLKVKASIGSQGNDNIGSFRYTDLFNIKLAGDSIATTPSSKGNENITWETNTNINAGVEFTLFGERLDGSVEYFDRKTTDMLFYFTLPLSYGYTGYYDNVGDMRNYGVEFSLSYDLLHKRDLNWNVSFNATKVMNRITMLHERNKTATVEGYQGYSSGNYFYGEGLSLYTRYIKKWAGVDRETGEPQWYVTTTDENGNEVQSTTKSYNAASYYLADNPIPDWYGGLSTSFSWRGFDFSVNTTWQLGGQAYDSGYASMMTMPYNGSTGKNFHQDVLKAWSPENPDSDIPRLVYGDQYSASTSTRFLTDASYLNIDNINVGYTFPSRWTRRAGIQSVRLYAACENVAYWSVRQGFDPRYSFSGTTNNTRYSPIRTLSGGITLKF